MTSSSGQHKATVILDGKADGLDQAARGASKRVGELEGQVEKLSADLAKATARLDDQAAAMKRTEQRARELTSANKEAARQESQLAAARDANAKSLAAASRAIAAQQAAIAKSTAAETAARKATAAAEANAAQRQREVLAETGAVTKQNLSQHLAAIERERAARLNAIEVERTGVRTKADAIHLTDQADQVRHEAVMQRLAAEREEQTHTARVAATEATQRKAAEKDAKTARAAAEKDAKAARAADIQALGDRASAVSAGIDVAQQAAATLDKLAARSLNLDNVQRNNTITIDQARTATKGLISDYDLQRLAIEASRAGVAKTSEEFAKAAKTAVALGVSVGEGATPSLEGFIAKLDSASTSGKKAEAAQEAYAASLGKTADELTEAEKKQAVIIDGLDRGAKAAANVEIKVNGMAGAWARAKVHIDNTTDAVLQFDQNVAGLSEEALMALGLTGKQARSVTSDVWEGFKDSYWRTATGGVSDLAGAIGDLTESTDEMAQSAKRGAVELSPLGRILKENATWAERASAAFDMAATSLGQQIGEQDEKRQQLARLMRDQQDVQRWESQRQMDAGKKKIEDDKAKAIKEFDAEVKKSEEAAKERAKEAEKAFKRRIDLRRAELELVVAGAQRDRELLEAEGASLSQRMDMLETLSAAEQAAAELEYKAAKTKTEQLRALGALQAQQHQAAVQWRELESQAEAESIARNEEDLRLNRESIAIGEQALQQAMDRAVAMAQLEEGKALRGAGEIADPMERLAAETNARMALLDVQEAAANDTMTVLQIADQREQLLHEQKLARIEDEKRARLESLATMQEWATKSGELLLGLGETALRAALLERGSVRAKVAAAAKAQAFEFGVIQGPRELILAGISAASFNPIGAAAHLAMAAQSFAFGAAMGAIGGVAGAGGGKQVAGGVGAASFGGGGGSAGGRGGGSGGSSSPSNSPIPPSQEPNVPRSAPMGGSSGGTVHYIFSGPIYANSSKDFVKKIDRDTRDLGYSNRRVSNG